MRGADAAGPPGGGQEEFERADRYDELTDAETAGLSQEEKSLKTRKVPRARVCGCAEIADCSLLGTYTFPRHTA